MPSLRLARQIAEQQVAILRDRVERHAIDLVAVPEIEGHEGQPRAVCADVRDRRREVRRQLTAQRHVVVVVPFAPRLVSPENRPDALVVQLRRVVVGKHSREGGIRFAQGHHRILRVRRRPRGAGDRDGRVVAGRVQGDEIFAVGVGQRRAVARAIARADGHLGRHRVRHAQPRLDLPVIRVDERLLAFLVGEPQRAGPVARRGVGQRQIEVGDVAVLLVQARQNLPAYAQVERELRRHLVVVLHVEVVVVLVVGVVDYLDGPARRLHRAQQEAPVGMPGLRVEPGQVRLRGVEVVGRGPVGAVAFKVIETPLEAGLDAVLAHDDRQIVLDDRAALVGRVAVERSVIAQISENRRPAEREPRERRIRLIGQPDLRRPAVIEIHAAIRVAEPVVAEGEVVQQPIADHPVLGSPDHPARRALQLIKVGRLARAAAP